MHPPSFAVVSTTLHAEFTLICQPPYAITYSIYCYIPYFKVIQLRIDWRRKLGPLIPDVHFRMKAPSLLSPLILSHPLVSLKVPETSWCFNYTEQLRIAMWMIFSAGFGWCHPDPGHIGELVLSLSSLADALRGSGLGLVGRFCVNMHVHALIYMVHWCVSWLDEVCCLYKLKGAQKRKCGRSGMRVKVLQPLTGSFLKWWCIITHSAFFP